jgi:hypothetical protein
MAYMINLQLGTAALWNIGLPHSTHILMLRSGIVSASKQLSWMSRVISGKWQDWPTSMYSYGNGRLKSFSGTRISTVNPHPPPRPWKQTHFALNQGENVPSGSNLRQLPPLLPLFKQFWSGSLTSENIFELDQGFLTFDAPSFLDCRVCRHSNRLGEVCVKFYYVIAISRTTAVN